MVRSLLLQLPDDRNVVVQLYEQSVQGLVFEAFMAKKCQILRHRRKHLQKEHYLLNTDKIAS
ncbi:hypothetical protein D3C84_1309880 [compost metagenome]